MNFDLQTGNAIADVQPRWLPPSGGEILVTVAEPRDAIILIDGMPCGSPSRVDLAIRCIAPQHAPGNVVIAIEDEGPWERLFTYMTRGSYQFGGTDNDNTSGIAVDEQGNVVVSGGTLGALDGPNAGDWDAVVVKYDASGALQWTRQLGTALYDYARDVAVDADGGVTIAGYTAGGLDGANAGSYDIFVARYSAAGELQWIAQTGSAGDDQVWDLAIDAAGYTVVAARTTGVLAGSNSGGNDFAIVRYTPAGEVDWIDQGGTASEDIGHSIAVTPSGVAYLVGYTSGTLEQANAGMMDIIVARYEPDGTRAWLRQRGSPAVDEAHDAHVAIDGSVWIVGRTNGSLDGNAYAGSGDLFAMKYAPDGTWQLTRQFGSAGNEDTFGVGTSVSGQVFLSCNTVMPFDGQPYVGGSNDICVVSLDPQGNHLWTRIAGSAGGDQASSVAVDTAHTGLVYVSAITDNSLDGMANRGLNDFAVAKLDDSGMLR